MVQHFHSLLYFFDDINNVKRRFVNVASDEHFTSFFEGIVSTHSRVHHKYSPSKTTSTQGQLLNSTPCCGYTTIAFSSLLLEPSVFFARRLTSLAISSTGVGMDIFGLAKSALLTFSKQIFISKTLGLSGHCICWLVHFKGLLNGQHSDFALQNSKSP